jgi:hypothetical protein
MSVFGLCARLGPLERFSGYFLKQHIVGRCAAGIGCKIFVDAIEIFAPLFLLNKIHVIYSPGLGVAESRIGSCELGQILGHECLKIKRFTSYNMVLIYKAEAIALYVGQGLARQKIIL